MTDTALPQPHVTPNCEAKTCPVVCNSLKFMELELEADVDSKQTLAIKAPARESWAAEIHIYTYIYHS